MWLRIEDWLINCVRVEDVDIVETADFGDDDDVGHIIRIDFVSGDCLWIDDFDVNYDVKGTAEEILSKAGKKHTIEVKTRFKSFKGDYIDLNFIDYFYADKEWICALKDGVEYRIEKFADNDAALEELDELGKELNGGGENVD